MTDHPGTFPFGCPSTERPPRKPAEGAATAFVLGVYQSALHVRWNLPTHLAAASGKPIGALAVDVEPVVFWDGTDASDKIAKWVDDRGLSDQGEFGTFGNASGNGSSGISVVKAALKPLKIDSKAVWFTDALPWYFVKDDADGQAKAQALYNKVAVELGRQPSDLPTRPSVAQLVEEAVTTRRGALRAELLESEAPLVITLGEEARLVAAGIADTVDGPPANELAIDLSDYGRAGSLTIDGTAVAWRALKHPGQHHPDWVNKHESWMTNPS